MSGNHYETIRYEKSGAVATLTMNRPDRLNAMTNLMLHEASVALAAAAEDREVRVLVLTGAGKSFCPGADLQVVASGSEDRAQARTENRSDASDFRVPVLLHSMPAVTIAAINGACAGAGLGWACACDFRFATPNARFNTAFLDVGVAGDMGGPWSLPRIIGAARARELYFLPGKFDAEEALRIGLVSRVFPEDRFRDEVGAIVQRIADAAPIALRTMKSNFIEAERMDLASYIALETAHHLPMFSTEDTPSRPKLKSANLDSRAANDLKSGRVPCFHTPPPYVRGRWAGAIFAMAASENRDGPERILISGFFSSLILKSSPRERHRFAADAPAIFPNTAPDMSPVPPG
jgi:2-(1,2-epoxy-1,2-dihydrophenyl)acetyl-CoA isomerase